MISPWIAFLAWGPISLYCFRRYPVRTALLANFLAGWALLPAGCYAPSGAAFPYWILGASLPSGYFFTKATVTSITGLIGIVFVDRTAYRHLTPSRWDLPMAVWCLVPMLSAIASAKPLLPALQAELYQCLAWGVPYLAGRIYFHRTDSLLLAAKAIVLAGLAYVPVCLLEIVFGPQLYALLYGYEPYRWVGAQRFVGFRPVGFMEDGNQLGLWMASAALVAVWLWRHHLVRSVARVPIAWAAAALVVVTLLCQSVGSIVLLFCLLFFAFVRGTYLPKVVAALLMASIVGALGLRLLNVVSLRSLVEHNRVAYESARALKNMRLGTFGWRLSQDERHVTTALQRPVLGWGRWDWWREGVSRPWSLWLLAFGMYGLLGLLALECLQIVPVARIGRAAMAGRRTEALELRTALAALLLMSFIDNLLNGSMILPFVLIVGGLSVPEYASAVTRSWAAT